MNIEKEKLEKKAYKIRRLCIEMITYGGWGHIGGSLSLADIFSCLYFRELKIDPDNPEWDKRDRLILSKAHGSPVLYSSLALKGVFDISKLYTYCNMEGLQGHTELNKRLGIEAPGGSLGQGLSFAVGKAFALRYRENPFNRVYCILGDGECNEGQVWEAAMAASHYKLDNLITIIDYNKVMAKGFVKDLMEIEPLKDKWQAFGWKVLEMDGHNITDICQTLYKARNIVINGKPVVIIAHTVKGKGLERAEFNYKWHTHAPEPELADKMLRELAQYYNMPEKGYSKI
ncbi:MAG: transketolase [Halanaerobiaceae bacterium]